MAIEKETYKLPYNRAIPLGLYAEAKVTLEGAIPLESKWFQVGFACGQYHEADVALRFNLHFKDSLPTSPATVVLKSLVKRRWHVVEEKQSSLQRGQQFKIEFIVTSDGYKIMEHGKLLCEFAHRLPPERVRFLEMDGDITLKDVRFSWEMYSNRTSVPRPMAPHSRWEL